MSQNQQLPDLSKGVTNKNQLFMHTVSTFSATKCIFSGRHNTPNAGQNTGLGLGEVRVSSSTDNWKEDCPFFSHFCTLLGQASHKRAIFCHAFLCPCLTAPRFRTADQKYEQKVRPAEPRFARLYRRQATLSGGT